MQHTDSSFDDAFTRAHQRLVEDGSLQFDRVGIAPPPNWLSWLGELMEMLGPLLKWLFWIAFALLAALILYAVGREFLRLRRPAAKARMPAAVQPEWRPDAKVARDLLAEADGLARRGLYGEAAHLLLLRSVEDIEKRQPRSVRVSLTTREIASLKDIPETARPAFAQIGAVVERSIFGGGAIGKTEFEVCRRAYENFAVPQGWHA